MCVLLTDMRCFSRPFSLFLDQRGTYTENKKRNRKQF